MTRERVTEDLRRLPDEERNDLTAIGRLATAQDNTYRAQVQAAENTEAHTRVKPWTQTLYVSPDPPRNPRRDRKVPYLPGHERMGFLSDLRNEDPELAERIADGLESILYLGDPGNFVTTTPTTMDSREIAASVGVDLKETPVLRDTKSMPKRTEDEMRKAFSVIPTDYWQLNCWTCRECGHSTFTCPTLTPEHRMYYAHQYYLDQVRTNPTMASFLAQKTQRRLNLANERARDEKTVRNNDQTMAPTATTRSLHPRAVLANPNRSERTNGPRRSNGGRPNDRRYGNRNTRFGRNGGTYVTIASEYEEDTNGPHGYHGDESDRTETRVMTKHPNPNGHDATETLRTWKTNMDWSHSCRLPVRNAPVRTRSTDSKRRTLRTEPKPETEAKTKSTSTKHDRKTNKERRPNEGPDEGPQE